ncbi:MAG: restriction endonuclease [Flavobacteriales bacterium]|nr:restriction endonuclease [Flavobacteriales bacterium]
MKKSGKNLETMVRIVEEVYKTDSNTQILSNHKIQNLDNNLREIDLLIKSIVNDYEVTIAIECKEYAIKIPVEKIESFNSKCLRIPNINKKIFVSEKGFQKDAIAAAKAFGIELYTFSKIKENPNEILKFPITQLKPKLTKYKITGINFEKPLSQKTIIDSNSIFRTDINGENLNFSELFQLFATPNWSTIMNYALLQWMEKKTKENEVIFEVNYKNLFLIYKNENIKIQSIRWYSVIVFNFIETKTKIREISNLNKGEPRAKTLNFTLDNKAEGSIVVDKNNDCHFFDTTNNKAQRLELLFSYDPKTNKIEMPKK